MKRIKKISVLILAIVFTFALSINAFAATVADGDYSIGCSMAGGTHERSITSATLHVNGGVMTADVQIDSTNYTWMSVGGTTFYNDNPGGYSTFVGIPVSALDTAIPVSAETVAMSEPHTIDYTLTFDSSSLPEGAIVHNTVEQETQAPTQEQVQDASSSPEQNTAVNSEETTTTAVNATPEATTDATTEAQSFVVKGEITSDGDKMTVVAANGKTYVIENGKLYEKNESGELVELTDNLANVSLFDANNNKLTLKDGKFVSDTDTLDDNSVKTTAAKADDTKKISPAPIVINVVIIAAAVVVCVVLVLKKKKSATTADGLTNDVNSSDNDNNN